MICIVSVNRAAYSPLIRPTGRHHPPTPRRPGHQKSGLRQQTLEPRVKTVRDSFFAAFLRQGIGWPNDLSSAALDANQIMSHRLSAIELELLKELAAAGRRGRRVPTTTGTGLARMIEMHYVTASRRGSVCNHQSRPARTCRRDGINGDWARRCFAFCARTDVNLWGAYAKFRGIVERNHGTLSEKKLIEMLIAAS